MIKKLIIGFALLATLSHASWDNLPIQKEGSIQIAGQISYMTMDPVSGPMLAAGARFSPLSWLELSAIVPFGIFSTDSTHKEIDESNLFGIMNSQFGLKFQLSTGFSLYVDGYLPGTNYLKQGNFASSGHNIAQENGTTSCNAMLPVKGGVQVSINSALADGIDFAYFYPCLGNV